MFGPIGGFELLVLVTLGLLVFGPRKLPEIGRTIGRSLADLRRAATDIRTSVEREVSLDDVKKAGQSMRRELEATLLEEPRKAASEITAPFDEAARELTPLTQMAAPPAPMASDPPQPDAERKV